MKRSVKYARLNSEFKRVQRLPLLAGDLEDFLPGRAVPSVPGITEPDGGLAFMEGERAGAEVHAIKCTNSY